MNLSDKIKINTWQDIEPYFKELKNRQINSVSELEKWIKDRSSLFAILDEELAWRYIKMTCDTENRELAEDYEFYVTKIQPQISKYEDELNKKLANNKFFDQLPPYYNNLKRSVIRELQLFREENVELSAKLNTLEQKYAQITGAMTVNFDGKELTMQQIANYLKNPDRHIREKAYKAIAERRLKDVDKLNNLLTDMVKIRHQIAVNAGFENFRDYSHDAHKRFDYTVDDVLKFDEAIKQQVVPIVEKITEHRKNKLNVDILKPWDMDVDTSGKEALQPFKDTDDFVEKTIKCFSSVRPQYGEYLKLMRDKGFLDLESRKGKAPGGYNYPLMVSNIPFIFMNATSNIRDVETLVHEGGHAIHAFKAKDIDLTEYKSTPSEMAELASMSMELISMEHWDVYFDNEDDLRRAKIHQLEGVLSVLPWVATVDKFQHWLYTNYNHDDLDRAIAWGQIYREYSSKLIDYSGVQWYALNLWQKQLHIFEIPFYYIEYAISQLGAIAIWKNYRQNAEQALNNYEKALSLGYTVPLPELYKAAGIKFDFSADYIEQLISFVYDELMKLYKKEQ